MNRQQASTLCSGPWRARMIRDLGIAAEIVVFRGGQFGGGQTVIRWNGSIPSIAVYETPDAMRAVHGHGDTVFVWIDTDPTDGFMRGVLDCEQDKMENSAFASIGGTALRHNPKVPNYIHAEQAAGWLRGYETACCSIFGEDWRTCEMGWSPAVVIS